MLYGYVITKAGPLCHQSGCVGSEGEAVTAAVPDVTNAPHRLPPAIVDR